MSSQLVRLASFASWPSSAAVSSLALARSGFKYTGHGESTVCVECQLVVESWQSGDHPDQVHSQQSPNCPFVRSQLEATDSSILRTAAVGQSSHNIGVARRVHSSTVSDSVTRPVNSVSSLPGSTASHVPLSCTIDRDHPDFERLKDESVRLSTFHDWPERVALIVEPHDLAKAGMFYTGLSDRVQCAFCRGYLRNWVPGDNPAEEHRRHFPDCSFSRQWKEPKDTHDGRNANLTASVVDSPASASRVNPTQFQSTASEPPLPALSRPKHPYYASEQHRVESFAGAQVPRGQSVEVLAKAGFFHVGPGDNVCCYYCDGGLKNWQPTDEPWTEHRRWFTRCPHLQPKQRLPPIPTQNVPRNPVSNYSATRQPTVASAVNHTNVQYRIEPREIKARLDAPIVQAVIKMGFDRSVIRKAIEQRLMTTGDDFPNAHSLLEAVLAAEEEGSAPTQTGNSPAASSAAAAAATVADAVSVSTPATAPVNLANEATSSAAAMNVDVTNTAATCQQDAATSELNITDKTLPPKPKSKKKKKKNKSQTATNDANITDVNINNASAAPTTLVSSSVPTTEMLKENEKLREERTCKVCMDAEVNTVFLPCGHFVCCAECSHQLQTCPICRVCISGTVRASVS